MTRCFFLFFFFKIYLFFLTVLGLHCFLHRLSLVAGSRLFVGVHMLLAAVASCCRALSSQGKKIFSWKHQSFFFFL